MPHNDEHFWQLLTEVRQEVRELRQEVSRYKGFIGGVLWVVSALSAGVGALVTYFAKGN